MAREEWVQAENFAKCYFPEGKGWGWHPWGWSHQCYGDVRSWPKWAIEFHVKLQSCSGLTHIPWIIPLFHYHSHSINMNIDINICVHMYSYKSINLYTYISIYLYGYISIYIYISIYLYISIYIYIYIYIYPYPTIDHLGSGVSGGLSVDQAWGTAWTSSKLGPASQQSSPGWWKRWDVKMGEIYSENGGLAAVKMGGFGVKNGGTWPFKKVILRWFNHSTWWLSRIWIGIEWLTKCNFGDVWKWGIHE